MLLGDSAMSIAVNFHLNLHFPILAGNCYCVSAADKRRVHCFGQRKTVLASGGAATRELADIGFRSPGGNCHPCKIYP